jgi:hypothetical protein
MKSKLMAGIAGVLLLVSSAAFAQYSDQSSQDSPAQDEPIQNESVQNDQPLNNQAQNGQPQKETGVARVSFIHGDVSTQRGDSGDWATAALNAPIVTGDRLAAGDRSRAELQLDFANILRLEERTEANVTALTRTQIQIQLSRGLANYSVLKDSEADVELDAPNLSVHPRRGDGRYEVTVISDEQAEVVVRKGEADISTPNGSTNVRSGQMITVTGSGDATQYRISDAPSRDDFDRWASDRDRTIHNAQSYARTNRYYVGSEDLDTYGRWTNVPDYGDVWVPTAASGWTPYRDGRWVWEPYWGWTWVSYEPWGWAPYHYGRWFMYGSSWVWWPGQSYGYRNYRPLWAPAYVSFFGFGGGGIGFEFGGGFGSVGWLPIGPCDGFNPWWGGYRSRFNVVNIYNVHNVYNYRNGAIPPLRRGTVYSNLRLARENDRMRQAISTVPSRDFGRGRVTAQPVSREAFRNGRMVTGNLPVVPGRESLFAGERRAAPPSVARQGQNQRFFSTNHNLQARPQSFDREAADLHNAIQRDGHFTPIVGNSRSNAGDTNPRGATGRVAGENSNMGRPFPGLRSNGAEQRTNGPSNSGSNPNGNRGVNQNSNQPGNQNWRRMGTPAQAPSRPVGAMGNEDPRAGRGANSASNSDWRRGTSSNAPQGIRNDRPSNSGGPGGRVNAPVERRDSPAPQAGGANQDWRRNNRPSEPVSRGVNRPADAPSRSDRPQGVPQRESSPPFGRPNSDRPNSGRPNNDRSSNNDWRGSPSPAQRGGSMDRPSARDSYPPSSRESSPRDSSQRDSGGWRQPAPRDNRQMSRPSLDMRQPIVTPRSSGGGYSGGGYPSGNRGGYNGGYGGGGARPAPSGGGYSAPSHGGGGYSAPSHSGGGSPAPSHGGGGGGQPHSSGGGNNGPHRGR